MIITNIIGVLKRDEWCLGHADSKGIQKSQEKSGPKWIKMVN